MSVLLSFPGQGSQFEGMLQGYTAEPITKAVVEEASDSLGEDILLLDSKAALEDTRAVQLCLLVAGVASARRLLEGLPAPDYVSGLSIGAYAAAVLSGALAFSDAVRLVSVRGRLMQEAYPHGYGMTTILGLSVAEVERLIEPYMSKGLPIYLANINAELQHAVAGRNDLLVELEEKVLSRSFGNSKRINISVPSHCELLYVQACQLMKEFDRVRIYPFTSKYISCSSARVLFNSYKLKEDLAFNMSRVINWQAVMESSYERGVRLHVQLAPGSVLKNIGRILMPGAINESYQDSNLKVLKSLIENNI